MELISVFLLGVVGVSVLLVITDRFVNGWRRPLVIGGIIIMTIVGLRAIFLDSALAWKVYSSNLVVSKDITLSQSALFNNRVKESNSAFHQKKYVALGTSQVEAIFDSQESISFMHKPSLKLYEYPFFENAIFSKDLQGVIVYISEFDVTQQPEESFYAIKLLPDNLMQLFLLMSRYVEIGKNGWIERAGKFKTAIYENIIPEIKYGYIARAFLNRWMGMDSINMNRESVLLSESDQDFIKRIDRIKKATFECVDPTYSTMDWSGLDDFISFFERKSVMVIILEGQYLPEVMHSAEAIKANGIFLDKIRLIQRMHSNVIFILRNRQMLFSADDYMTHDWLHVNQAAAALYTNRLVEIITQMNMNNKTPLR